MSSEGKANEKMCVAPRLSAAARRGELTLHHLVLTRYGGNLNAFDSKVQTNLPPGTGGLHSDTNPSYSTGPSSSQCVASPACLPRGSLVRTALADLSSTPAPARSVTEGKPVESRDVDATIGDKSSTGPTFSSNTAQRAGTSHLDEGGIVPDRADAGKRDYSALDKLINKIPGVHPSGGA